MDKLMEEVKEKTQESHPLYEAYEIQVDSKPHTLRIHYPLNAYIEKYKQRVAKAAAKAAGYKVQTTAPLRL